MWEGIFLLTLKLHKVAQLRFVELTALGMQIFCRSDFSLTVDSGSEHFFWLISFNSSDELDKKGFDPAIYTSKDVFYWLWNAV